MAEKITRYSAPETAKVIRRILKEKFPGQKFSVRSDTYSMGCSVHISWMDGPSLRAVEQRIDILAGSGFDGSIDLKYSKYHWLLPDGSVQVARCEGTVGSGGDHPRVEYAKPHPEAKLVQFADHISCQRVVSEAFLERAVAQLQKRFGGLAPVVYLHAYESMGAYLQTQDYSLLERYNREIAKMEA